jgi:hypothetical protein
MEPGKMMTFLKARRKSTASVKTPTKAEPMEAMNQSTDGV